MTHPPNASFGSCLKREREKLGLTQAQLARLLATTTGDVGKVEKSDSITELRVRRYCEVMGLVCTLQIMTKEEFELAPGA